MLLSLEDSLHLIERDHERHTIECCPKIPTSIPSKTPIWSEFVREGYPVYYDTREKLVDKLYNFGAFSGTVGTDLYYFCRSVTLEEYLNNLLTKEHWQEIQQILARHKIKPLKRSPKLMNILQTIMEYTNLTETQQNDVVKFYNDRGNKVDNFEMVLTTEPHRIAGMSAYGNFTSCQDWIYYDSCGETHTYSHGSWACLQDPTIGIAFIREKDAKGPEDGGEEDMLARTIIRILPLENGMNVIYKHRIYGQAPYVQYLRGSLDAWAKSLPKNCIWIDMDYDSKHTITGKTGSGKELTGSIRVNHDVNFDLWCQDRQQCDDCDGEGYVEDECDNCDGYGHVDTEEDCKRCDGTGELEDESTCPDCHGEGVIENRQSCNSCDGSGYISHDCDFCDGDGYIEEGEVALPYNDHCDWLDFYSNHIEFNVPEYVVKFFDNDEVQGESA